jgi:hypothetical protein
MSAFERLLSVSSPALGPDTRADKILDGDLQNALRQRNGFFALQNALWFFSDESLLNLPGHNHPLLSDWINKYPRTKGVRHAFAVDAIGYPFFTSDFGILRLDLETGRFVRVAETLEGWAERIVKEYSYLTAWPLMRDWQDKNGPLPMGHRLLPKMPFVGGGKEEVDNMFPVPLTDLIAFYEDLSAQIRDMPEGGTIEIRVS